MPAPSKRALILESAARIVEAQGAGYLTIDAVASASNVSKGGVLYHFPTKQALLEGMVDSLLTQLAHRTDAHRATHAGSANAVVLARILEEHEQQPGERAMARAILAAAAERPELLEAARLLVRQTFEEAAAGSDPAELGWVILLAVEGLRFLDMLKLLPLAETERERVHATLLDLAGKSAR